MQHFLKKYFPHLVSILLFVVISLLYFSPVLQGKKMLQTDIVQYTGMSKQQVDHRKETGEETYWTDAAFGGMPTYQLGAKYPNNFIKKLDLTIRFLPRPADYLFLYFICFYILMLVMKLDFKLAFLGAIAFGFSTYLIIILGAGHNAKAHAIAYMPLVLSGIILTFRGKYFYGFLLTAVAMGLELVANHFQMTYYLFLLVLIIGVAYLIDAFKKKMLPQFAKAVGVMVIAVLIGLGLNATNIMATKEYADTSTRGPSALTINPDGSPKQTDGLDYDYITEYSYGRWESFNLFIPRFMGGGSADMFPEDSETIDELIKMGAGPNEANEILSQLPLYWGDQTYVAAPAYIGAIVVFLALMAVFLVKGRLRWWVVSAFVLSLLLSWGRNFSGLTEFFIENIPYYNKFRAVSSIQVIIELILPVLAVVGLHHFFNKFGREEDRKKALLYSLSILIGVGLVLLLFKSALLDFASPYDQAIREQLGTPLIEAVRADRMALFTSDTFRSLVFVLLTGGVLWFFLKDKLKRTAGIVLITLLIGIDLVSIDRKYVNNDNFKPARLVDAPFQETLADKQILEDDGHFRVYDITSDPFRSARASYFHNSLGGYHAAKPGRIQDLDDFYLAEGNIGVLNMMNVRYIITRGPNGTEVAQRNPYANGNAWFVEGVMLAENADEEISLLDSLDTKKIAVINTEFKERLPLEDIDRDSLAQIELVSYNTQHLVYEASSTSPQLAIFSEAYYPEGWNAYINGELTEHIRANYALRALPVPVGNNKIEFKFEPAVIKKGSTISLATSVLFVLLGLGGAVYFNRRRGSD